jgi:tetratricopeptide (TPR) repeat protein
MSGPVNVPSAASERHRSPGTLRTPGALRTACTPGVASLVPGAVASVYSRSRDSPCRYSVTRHRRPGYQSVESLISRSARSNPEARNSMKLVVAAWCALVISVTTWAGGEENAEKKGHFLTPRELAELGDKSKVSYGTTIVKNGADLPSFRHPGFPKDGPLPETAYPEISAGSDGSRSLYSFQLSTIARKAIEEAEPLFQSKKYEQALPIYREASLKDPKCYVLFLSIGDCYLFSGNPLAALDNYDQAIALNADDYHGHWFRASALVELGKTEEARHSYARALAMSPRNPSLLKAINARSTRLGIRAREELFHPQATARPDGDKFVIYTVEGLHWWLYGLCKAVWLAEEGHRRDLTGSADHGWTNTEELECMGTLLASYRTDRDEGKGAPEPELDLLLEVLSSGNLDAFVNYEFGSQFSKDYAILLDTESQEKLARFVEQYVFQKE